MTRQEAFNIALDGLRKQKAFSRGEDGYCVFRGPDGKKCAIGFLIPDELYDSKWDSGEQCIFTIINEILIVLELDTSEYEFYKEMQESLHDNLKEDFSDLEDSAKRFAEKWNLKYEICIDSLESVKVS